MPEQVKVRQHQWVKMTICPIEVLPDANGQPVPFVDPEKQIESEDRASYGCFACSTPLEGNYGTECTTE